MSDSIFFNGTLLTQDPTLPRAEALAVRSGRIEAVGSREDVENLAGPGTKRIDLEGRTLLPGFNDSHVHVWKVGQILTGILDLRGLKSLEELRALLRRRDRELPEGAWLLGRGYNEERLAEGRQPTRRDLDGAAPNRPVALTRTCGHMMVGNSRALALAGVGRETPDPPGGAIVRDASGEPTGLVQENAMGLLKAVIPEPTAGEYAEMVLTAGRDQLSKGITSASEAGATPSLLDAYRDLDLERKLPHRFHVMAMRLSEESARPLPLPGKHLSAWLRIDSVKLFADGGLSGATAALKGTYRHQPFQGLARLSEDEIVSLALGAQDAGLRVCTHAIGDAAIGSVLTAYERLHQKGGRGHRLEHFGLPDGAQIERARRHGEDPAAFARLAALVTQNYGFPLFERIEQAKRTLSTELEATVALHVPEIDLDVAIRRAAFNQAIRDEMSESRSAIRQVLKLADVAAEGIDVVVTTGGSSAIPIFQTLLVHELPQARLVQSDLFGSVTGGLAIQAHQLDHPLQ